MLSLRQNLSIPKPSGLFCAAGWEHRSHPCAVLLSHRSFPKALTTGAGRGLCRVRSQCRCEASECGKCTHTDHPAPSRAAAAGLPEGRLDALRSESLRKRRYLSEIKSSEVVRANCNKRTSMLCRDLLLCCDSWVLFWAVPLCTSTCAGSGAVPTALVRSAVLHLVTRLLSQ